MVRSLGARIMGALDYTKVSTDRRKEGSGADSIAKRAHR
jgi:hypothetical protein